MTDFGMPTLLETDGHEACACLCASLGLRFIELNMNLPEYQCGNIDVTHFKSIAEKHGIYYTVHLDENLNAADFNPYVAEAYRRTVRETIALAKRLDAPILNMHLPQGVYFTMPDEKVYLFERYGELYKKSMADFRDMCEEEIGGAKITVCVENCGGYPGFQVETLDILLQSRVFGLTFDVGHNNGSGGVDEAVVMQRKDRLCHMHVYDGVGKANHLPLGTGEIDLRKYLSLAETSKSRVVLETKTVAGLGASVRWLGDRQL